MRELSPTDRGFFELIRAAAFSNPFSDARRELDSRIAATGRQEPYDEVMQRAAERVTTKISELGQGGKLNLSDFVGDDRERVKYGVLFQIYHNFHQRFDAHIEAQVSAGHRLVKLEFGGDVIAALTSHGIPLVVACSYVGMFFQLRRAFWFIDRGLVGSSACMRKLRRHLWDNVFTHDMSWYEHFLWNRMEDFSTLLLGETGTGKGAAALAIGQSGFIPFDEARQRFARSFTGNLVSLNLSQFPEALIESELFGHRRGAFTGAVDDHEGMFARCPADGAILLDEIGEVSVPVQIKLLQVLQERSFSPVGSHEAKRFKGRVIAATNRDIESLRAEGLFRDDFYYRLCSDVITMPPLRQRIDECREEMDELLGTIIRRVTGKMRPGVLARVKQVLADDVGPSYAWPGNVRELEQAVRRILITQRYVPQAPRQFVSAEERLCERMRAGGLTAQELLAAYCAMLYDQMGAYGDVARVTDLDWRTVKKYVLAAREAG